jgi:hypothetical protein
VQRRFRVELSHGELADILRRHCDLALPANSQLTMTVDAFHLDEYPIVIEWTTTEVTEPINA